ncbi:MAG: hypothetical protein BWX50_01484 [Euryarchaeota archaeon ADurb.Bin009]|nr:MAG: hypothetical protein BWX50_01484 [Euryarchaeota archaeon ADurb.Bin009]
MIARAAISNPAIRGSTFGMKLIWISAAIWSSAFDRASRPSISRRSVMSRIDSMAPVTVPSGSYSGLALAQKNLPGLPSWPGMNVSTTSTFPSRCTWV